MYAHHLPHVPDERRDTRNGAGGDAGRPSRGARIAAAALLTVTVAASCGSDDGSSSSGEAGVVTEPNPEQATRDTLADQVVGADPDAVADCLADAGFVTVDDDDLLSEQQRADMLTLSGQTDSLTFDAATTSFAGGVTFFDTPAQAQERSKKLSDVAEELVVVGNALISIEAGAGYESAVAAAEGCL
jgi:hypothetical protein